MKFYSLYRFDGVVKYPGVLLRFPMSLIIANYLVMYGEPEGFFDFFSLPHYYTSLIGSLIITLLVSELIFISTKILDYKYTWLKDWYRRIALQTVVCVVIPIVLVYFAASYYFKLHGLDINQTNYLRYDITVVVCFILLLNSYYLINYLLKVKLERKKKRLSNYHEQQVVDADQFAVVYSERKGCMAVDFNGKQSLLTSTLKEVLSQLQAENYFLINRGDVVHRSNIIGFEPAESRTLRLILRVETKRQQAFIVSQRRVADFKKWFMK